MLKIIKVSFFDAPIFGKPKSNDLIIFNIKVSNIVILLKP